MANLVTSYNPNYTLSRTYILVNAGDFFDSFPQKEASLI